MDLSLVADIGGWNCLISIGFSHNMFASGMLGQWRWEILHFLFWFSNIWILFVVVTLTSHGSSLNLYSTFCLRFWWNVFFGLRHELQDLVLSRLVVVFTVASEAEKTSNGQEATHYLCSTYVAQYLAIFHLRIIVLIHLTSVVCNQKCVP